MPEIAMFLHIIMTSTLTGSLIHLCIENFQEKALSQQHNEVTITETDSFSQQTNHKIEAKNSIPGSRERSQILFLILLYPSKQ